MLKYWKTRTLVPRSEVHQGKNVLPSDFQLKNRRLEDGSVDVYKDRLCAGWHKQEYGSDYHPTYAPVIGFDVVRLVLAIASKKRMIIGQVDIKGAFLYSDIDTDIYIEQPKSNLKDSKKGAISGTLSANCLRIFMA